MIREQTFLGFDYGTKFIGIAVGQTVTRTAKPLTAIRNRDNSLWQQIASIIKEWRPDGLVVGLPLNMDGTEQPLTEEVKAFGEALRSRFGLPVYFSDERLSTVEAREHIFSKKGYRGLEKPAVDAVSAQIILESWMAGMNSQD